MNQKKRRSTVLNTTNTVTVNNVSKSYHSLNGETEALKDISFEIANGEFISIVGPSGCGKSTLLSVMAGLIPPTSGTVTINGSIIYTPSSSIGYMFQKDCLLEWRSVYRNTLLGLEISGQLSDASKARVLELLQSYGLFDFKDKYPSQLSGGMRQRVALIRTLATNPDLLLLDEAFSALDYQTEYKVRKAMQQSLNSPTIIVVAQRISSILHADTILVLEEGEIVGRGTHSQLMKECPIYRQIASSQLSQQELESYAN